MTVKIQRRNQQNGSWQTVQAFDSWPKIGTTAKKFLWWTWEEDITEDASVTIEKAVAIAKTMKGDIRVMHDIGDYCIFWHNGWLIPASQAWGG
jgi:hypothetical protein